MPTGTEWLDVVREGKSDIKYVAERLRQFGDAFEMTGNSHMWEECYEMNNIIMMGIKKIEDAISGDLDRQIRQQNNAIGENLRAMLHPYREEDLP